MTSIALDINSNKHNNIDRNKVPGTTNPLQNRMLFQSLPVSSLQRTSYSDMESKGSISISTSLNSGLSLEFLCQHLCIRAAMAWGTRGGISGRSPLKLHTDRVVNNHQSKIDHPIYGFRGWGLSKVGLVTPPNFIHYLHTDCNRIWGVTPMSINEIPTSHVFQASVDRNIPSNHPNCSLNWR